MISYNIKISNEWDNLRRRLEDRSKREVRTILKRLDLTNNDIDGPIGTAYVDYDNALSRVY